LPLPPCPFLLAPFSMRPCAPFLMLPSLHSPPSTFFLTLPFSSFPYSTLHRVLSSLYPFLLRSPPCTCTTLLEPPSFNSPSCTLLGYLLLSPCTPLLAQVHSSPQALSHAHFPCTLAFPFLQLPLPSCASC
jgi:hypothetical protein